MNNVHTTCLVGYGHEPHEEGKAARFDGFVVTPKDFFFHRRAGVWESGKIGGGKCTGDESSKRVRSGRNKRKLLTMSNTSQSKKG